MEGARGVFRGRLLIISGGNPPGSGVYVYTPSVGAGKLIASVANSGTDQPGNHINPGLASYALVGPRYVSIFQSGGQIAFATAATEAGPYTVQGIIDIDSATNALSLIGSANNGLILASQGSGLVLVNSPLLASSGQLATVIADLANTTAGGSPVVRITSAAVGDTFLIARVAGDTAARVKFDTTAGGFPRLSLGSGTGGLDTVLYRAGASQIAASYIAFNNAGAAETWNAVAFANGWANAAAGPNMQYRRVAAPYNSVQVIGKVVIPAGFVTGQAMIAALPAAYRPTNAQSLTGWDLTLGAAVRFQLGAGGVVTWQGTGGAAPAAGDTVEIIPHPVSLDA